MRTIIYPYWLIVALVLFSGSAALAAYYQQLYLLAAPFLLLLVLVLIQHPILLFYLLTASIPWSAEINITPALGTDLPDEPLMLLVSFTVLVAFASGKAGINRKWHPLILILIIHFLWMIVTVITSGNWLLSVKYLLAKSWYLLAFVAAPLILLRNRDLVRRTAVILCISMGAVVLTALIRHYVAGFRFDAVNDALYPFFRNHVTYSSLLVFTLPVQAAFLSNKRTRPLVYGTIILTLAALYFSYSRGAWLAVVTGLIAYWLLRHKFLVTAYVAMIILMVGLVFWLKKDERYVTYAHDYQTTIFHEDLREHLVATYELKDMSTAERFYRWIAGVRMIPDSWKTGLGPSTFYSNYKSYTVPAFKTWISRNEEQSTVHNYFLLLLIEQGVMGFILFVVIIAMMFYYAGKIYHRAKDVFWKRTAAAVASVLAMICTLNFLSDLIETDKVGSIFYLCLSVLIIADRQTASDTSPNIQGIS